MAHLDTKPPDPDLQRVPFWPVFAQSRIPMALVDRERRYVRVNEATIRVFEYPRAEVLGSLAGRTAVGDRSASEAEWQQLLRTDELYGENVVAHASGRRMHVSYAAHATTTVGNCWLALFVTLSARFLPDGQDLIGAGNIQPPGVSPSTLTRRETEVVRLVALGLDTRRIAADLDVSPETVRTHVRNAMARTGTRTRAQLVAQVLADRLIRD
jgi:DNA-binding CsgD family transcriptional regulator